RKRSSVHNANRDCYIRTTMGHQTQSRIMIKSAVFNRLMALLLACSLGSAFASVMMPQSGGASAFQGQDIMGGAAIVFKRPQRVRDIVGGASILVVRRQPRPPRPEVARNNPNPRRPRPQPGEPEVVDAKS